jgi:hypothetical protein
VQVSAFQLFALFAIVGLLFLVWDLCKLRRKLREVGASGGDPQARTAQQEWLIVRNLRLTLPADAVLLAEGLLGLLIPWRLVDNPVMMVLFVVTIVTIVVTSYAWSFRGLPPALRHWLFDPRTR